MGWIQVTEFSAQFFYVKQNKTFGGIPRSSK